MRIIKTILVLIGTLLLFCGMVGITIFLFPIQNLQINISVEEAIKMQEYLNKILILFTVPAFIAGFIFILSLQKILKYGPLNSNTN